MKNQILTDNLLVSFSSTAEKYSVKSQSLITRYVVIAFLIAPFLTQNLYSQACETPENVQVEYENGMATADVSWEGAYPENGWILLYGMEGTTDINLFLMDPENFESPETSVEFVTENFHTIYMNMFHPGGYELYVVADCGDDGLFASEPFSFMKEEEVEEVIDGECMMPENVIVTESGFNAVEVSWEPNDGELYHIAWGPFGLEMNEGFFDDPETGSVIVSENPFHLQFIGPNPMEQKSYFIRKFCGDNRFSEWAVPICTPPTDLNYIEDEETITLTWVPGAEEFAWQIAYGPEGFDVEDEANPEVYRDNIYNTPEYEINIEDLLQGETYEFYVRANCSGNDFSPWTGPISYTVEIGECFPPIEVEANHITHVTADISWEPGGGEISWTVTYGLAPLDPDEAISIPVTNTNLRITDLDEETEYELFVTSHCVDGQTGEGDSIFFTTAPGASGGYCLPLFPGSCDYGSLIDNFIVTGENETEIYDLNTGCSESDYEDKTDISVDLAPGNEYFAVVSAGLNISGNRCAIWIDFNDDGIFQEDEKVAAVVMHQTRPTQVNFEIPEGVNPGEHRMRVMVASAAYPEHLTPCNNGLSPSTNGEVHDYTVNILEIDQCVSASAGIPADSFEVCPEESFTISVSGTSDPAEGLERTWQSSPAGQNIWTDIETSSTPIFTVYDGINQATDFRYKITCIYSGETSISDVLEIGMSTNCYCKPTSTCSGPGGLQVNNVTLIGETVAIDNDSGCEGDGYADFTLKFPPDLKQGETYTLSVTANNTNLNDDNIKAWIDFNDNKVFESQEVILDVEGVPTHTVTSDFTVPTTIEPGIYRLRIRVGWLFSTPIEGCSNLGWGETEDYLIEVVEGDIQEVCVEPSDVIVDNIRMEEVEVSWTQGDDETIWHVANGPEGFDPDTVSPIIVENTPSVLIDNLEPNTSYDVYVRSYCETDLQSDWVGPISYITDDLSIDNPYFENFKFYPNPTMSQLYLESFMPIEKIELFSALGEQVLANFPNSIKTSINLNSLSTGVYFMKVTISGIHNTFKIVKE